MTLNVYLRACTSCFHIRPGRGGADVRVLCSGACVGSLQSVYVFEVACNVVRNGCNGVKWELSTYARMQFEVDCAIAATSES